MVLGLAPKKVRRPLSPPVRECDRAAGRYHRPHVVVASVPRVRAQSPECQRIEITSTKEGTFATFVGLKDPATGKELRSGFADPNLRPAIVGVFTDLVGPARRDFRSRRPSTPDSPASQHF